MSGVEAAISAGGIIFAYLGLSGLKKANSVTTTSSGTRNLSTLMKLFERAKVLTNFISVLKFLVPLLVVVTLFAFFKPENLHAQGIAPQ
jgi:amino acid transporter